MKKLICLPVVLIMLSFIVSWNDGAQAQVCTTTVTAPGSIQDAVDAASPGDIICLDGTFSDVPTVTISTSDITLKSASPAILDGGVGPAFRLDDGVSGVTIEDLEIKNRTGDRGGGVEAWDVSTSNITIRNNYMHGLGYNGVLVGSEGGFIHDNWMVKDNRVETVGFAGVELTNCEDCSILDNEIKGAYIGVVVQARSTSTTGVGMYDVVINAVNVIGNMISGAPIGVYALSFTGHPTDFSPITGASSLLSNVNISNNSIESSGTGVIFWAYNDAATAENGKIMHNGITCEDTGTGVGVFESGDGESGTVNNVKVVNNDFVDCDPEVSATPDTTKIPPGPFLP
jgi:hypothetical protein